VIFNLLDPDPDQATQINAGSETLVGENIPLLQKTLCSFWSFIIQVPVRYVSLKQRPLKMRISL
jgi:hypothetical protein